MNPYDLIPPGDERALRRQVLNDLADLRPLIEADLRQIETFLWNDRPTEVLVATVSRLQVLFSQYTSYALLLAGSGSDI